MNLILVVAFQVSRFLQITEMQFFDTKIFQHRFVAFKNSPNVLFVCLFFSLSLVHKTPSFLVILPSNGFSDKYFIDTFDSSRLTSLSIGQLLKFPLAYFQGIQRLNNFAFLSRKHIRNYFLDLFHLVFV